jgi:hypothetical protein
MAEKISVQIALEGGAEVQRQLADIGDAGQKAFEQIEQSATQVGGFKNLKPEEVSKKLEELGLKGTEAFEKIQKAVATAVRWENVVQGVTMAEKAFVALGTAATVAGVAVVGIGAALVAGLAALSGYIPAAAKTAQQLRSLSELGGNTTESISALQIAFAQGGVSVEQFAKQFTDLQVKVEEAARTMADDIEQSSRRIEQAQLAESQASLNVEQAELALRKIRGFSNPLLERRLQLEQAEQRITAARLAQQQAQHAARVAEANDLAKVIEKFKDLGAGAPVAFDPLTTAATKTQALLATLAQAGDNWKSVLADILRNSSELERIQIGKALGLDPKMIETLSQGSAALNAAAEAAKRLGIALTDVDRANLKQATDSWNTFNATVSAIFQKLAAQLAPLSAALAKLGTAFITALAQGDMAIAQAALSELLDTLGQFLNEKVLPIGLAAGQVLANAILDGFKKAFTPPPPEQWLDWVLRDLKKFITDINKNVDIIVKKILSLGGGALITPAGAAEAPAGGGDMAQQFSNLATMAQLAQQAIDGIKSSLEAIAAMSIASLVDALNQIATIDIASALSGQIDELVMKFNELTQAAKEAAAAVGGMAPVGGGGGGGGGIPEEARGGLIGGRGSGTSDSNLAWLSRGEFVISAAAVRRLGAGFFAALNAGIMPRFALGGMVPAFAGGGPVGSMSHVTIQFPGLPPIAGLRASSAVVDELHRAAALAQVRSGGRKPSRYS